MNPVKTSLIRGTIATLILLAVYFLLVTLVSNWEMMLEQFVKYWYYIISLAVGFGIQFGLYTYLKCAIHCSSKGVIATTGSTSTLAMISCCSHYLVNILPALGVTGIISIVTFYQVQLFWIGLILNFIGIAFIVGKIILFYKRKNI